MPDDYTTTEPAVIRICSNCRGHFAAYPRNQVGNHVLCDNCLGEIDARPTE